MITAHGLCFHHYTDDLQLYCHFDLTATTLSATLRRMEDCLYVVNIWMASIYMCMNNNKTEYLPVIPKTAAATALVDGSVIRVGDATITVSRFVRNLGVVIDNHLNFKKQVSTIVRLGSFHLRHINKMSRYLPMATKERVVNAIITPRLDYCNCLMYGISVNRIHNPAARLILHSDSAMPLLCILHWLPNHRGSSLNFLYLLTKLCTTMPQNTYQTLCVRTNLREHCVLRTITY